MSKVNCPFCSPSVDSRIIYENHYSRLILTRDAIHPGQSLVISKRHVSTINQLSIEEWNSMNILAKDVADILLNSEIYDGVNILLNSGVTAGQTIHHSHLHIVPRISGDIPVAKEWLNPEFQKREYTPKSEEIILYSKIFKEEINNILTKRSTRTR